LKRKIILCYGDSNTWGYNPQDETRFSKLDRWTGVLEASLGSNYLVVEDGLNGRTTNLEDPDFPDRNGLDGLRESLANHKDIYLIILMLGTNDLKKKFSRGSTEIAKGILSLVEMIKESETCSGESKVLILPPPILGQKIPYESFQYSTVQSISKELPRLYREIAEKYSALYLNTQVEAGLEDGIHLDIGGHRQLGGFLYESLVRILP